MYSVLSLALPLFTVGGGVVDDTLCQCHLSMLHGPRDHRTEIEMAPLGAPPVFHVDTGLLIHAFRSMVFGWLNIGDAPGASKPVSRKALRASSSVYRFFFNRF